MAKTIQDLINTALGEVGYLEKASNAQLDNKTANAGDKNYTKYASMFDTQYTNFYNGKKNGYSWCDVFVDWCFVNTFGVDEAKRLLNQPNKSMGAGCDYSAGYYRALGRFYTSGPQVGDQIFFKSGSYSYAHTGLVVAVDKQYVYTVEGNTSGASGVIANGGGVCKKKYKLNFANIVGYGRPLWKDEQKIANTQTAATATKYVTAKVRQLSKDDQGNDVKLLQLALNMLGYDCGTADGDFGAKTETSLKKFQTKYALGADGVAGAKTWGKLLSLD